MVGHPPIYLFISIITAIIPNRVARELYTIIYIGTYYLLATFSIKRVKITIGKSVEVEQVASSSPDETLDSRIL